MMPFALPQIDWLAILPIAVVAVTGMLSLIIEMLWPKRTNNPIVMFALGGLALAALILFRNITANSGAESFAGMVVNDLFGTIMQLVLVVSGFLCILFSESYLREKRIPYGEFYPLLLWSISGGMVMASTHNLLTLFLGLEVLSISLYVLAGMSRSEERSEESAIKYFLLGAFATGFLLYGIAFLYGASGSLNVLEIGKVWAQASEMTKGLILFGTGLILVGLGFKSSFVPFHQWTPDVYQGAPTNVSAFMATGSKIAAFAALWRVLEGLQPLSSFWIPALFWIAILTMTVGNLVALLQKNVKRILAYSSIAHAGYILVAVIAHFKQPDQIGTTTVCYYLFSYALMTVGAFAILTMATKGGSEETNLSSLNGLWRRSPIAAIALAVCLFSLMGMPPTAGFVGKALIFMDALHAGLLPLALVLAANSAISIYYYWGIGVAAFVSEDEERELGKIKAGTFSTAALCSVGVIAAGLFFAFIGDLLK